MSVEFRIWQASAYVTLKPEAGLKDGQEKNLEVARIPDGGGAIFTHGGWRAWDFKLRFVPASDAAWLTACWSGTRLVQVETIEGGASRVESAMILDAEAPFPQHEPGAAGYFRGGLKLSGY